jgi:tetratricopeptide (TPR) repeat protein
MRFILALLVTVSLWAYEDFVRKAYYDSYNYEKMENYADAVRAIQVVYKRYPKAYTPNFRLGWLFYLNKNYADAIRHYKAAIAVVPTSAEAKLGLIRVFQAQQKHDEAKRLIYDILQSDLYNYYANRYLVDSLNVTGELDLSLKVIYKMLAYYPTDVFFLTAMAQIYARQKQTKLAESVFADVIILDPVNPEALEYLNRKQ